MKLIDEEKAKRRSALELELRVLRAQADDLCEQFDKELNLVNAKDLTQLVGSKEVLLQNSLEGIGKILGSLM